MKITHLIAAGGTNDVLSPRNLAKAYGTSYIAERSLAARGPSPVVPDLGGALRDVRVRPSPPSSAATPPETTTATTTETPR